MKEIYIELDGKQLPCRPTMGAMLRFKKETGRDAMTITDNDLEGNITFLWCCIVSACKHDGKEFDMSLMDFADAVGLDEVSSWADQLSAAGKSGDGAAATDGEKKTRRK